MAARLLVLRHVNFLPFALTLVAAGLAPCQVRQTEPVHVLNGHTSLILSDSGLDLIQAVATDSLGYVYIAGSTTSPDFPVLSAAQHVIGSTQLMRSTDRGATWAKLTSPPPTAGLPRIVPHPTSAQTLFAASGTIVGPINTGAVSKSTDAGASWNQVLTLTGSRTSGISQLAISPVNPAIVTADTSSGIAYSVDGGSNWSTPVCAFLECGSADDQLIADPFNAAGLAASFAAGQGPYVSSDQGRTFTSIRPDICCGSAVVLYDPLHRGWIYVAYNLGNSANLFLSTDGGKTWTAKKVPPQSFAFQTLTADPDLPSVLYATTVNAIYQSADAGGTWTTLSNPANPGNLASLAVLPRACGPGGLLTNSGFSPDFGKTWQPLPFGEVLNVATGPGCALYAARSVTSDAFIAKLSPDGSQILWATFLGGNENDSATALALDLRGNVYVAGTTASADFPASAPAAGAIGVFCARLDTSGQIVYSTVFNGKGVSGISPDGQGNVWLTGLAAANFPPSPAAFDTQYDSVNGDGYVAKIGPDGRLLFGSFLGTQRAGLAISVDSEGQPALAAAGYGTGFVLTLGADGSRISTAGILTQALGPVAIAHDAADNLYVSGSTAASNFKTTPGAYVSLTRSSPCFISMFMGNLPAADIFVMKLHHDLSPVFTALIAGGCGSVPGGLFANSAGEATFSLSSGTTFPLRDAPITQHDCLLPYSLSPTQGNGVVSRLSADGSALLFSSYTGACGAPAIASGEGLSVFAGLNFAGTADPRARMLRFPARVSGLSGARPR
jgi:hypothetical protein